MVVKVDSVVLYGNKKLFLVIFTFHKTKSLFVIFFAV